jgi:pimeloyl-ACP methyl ester carboxylesterase
MAMPLAQIGDIKINYSVQGAGDWVVLIGGYASGNWQAWGGQLDALAKSYRVLAFDNRGIGETDAPDQPYTTRMMAQDTLGLMRHLGVDRAHILGKSLGGAIAQWVALEEPARVRSIAMSSTFARRCNASMVNWWRDTAKYAGFERLFPGLLTYFFSAEYFEANPDAIERGVKALLQVNRPLHGLLHTGNGVITHDTWDRLGEIKAPAFVICGGEDIVTPPRHSEEIAQRLPKAEVHIVPRTLHGVMTERPDTFEWVLDFFKRH